MRISLQSLDPIPLDKHRHLLKEGDRVRVIEGAHAGRTGKLIAINAHRGHVVALDSGHEVEYTDSELEPEGFSSGTKAAVLFAPRHFDAEELEIAKTVGDPIPLGDCGPREPRALAKFDPFDPIPLDGDVPFASEGISADGLVKAIENGELAPEDRAALFANFEALRKGSSEARAIVAEIAARYSGRLAKRARSGLRVGMRVKETYRGKIGKIASIAGGLVKVIFDDGTCDMLEGVTFENLIPVES